MMESFTIENYEKFQKRLYSLDCSSEFLKKTHISHTTLLKWSMHKHVFSSETLEKIYSAYKGKEKKIDGNTIVINKPEDLGLKIVSIPEYTLGERIKSLLKQNNNMTQTDFAKEMEVDKSHISNIISNNKEPSLALVKKMSNYFGVSIEYLINGIVETSNDLVFATKLSQKSINKLENWSNPNQLFYCKPNYIYDINEIDVLNFIIENSNFFEIFTEQLKESSSLYVEMKELGNSKNFNMKIAREDQEKILQILLDSVKNTFRNMTKAKTLEYNKIDITKIM